MLLLQCPALPPRHNYTYFSCGLCPVVPSSTSYISCACALLLPCRRPVSPAPAPYFLLADALPLLRRVLPLPRLRLVSPIPCSSVLIPVSFRPRSKDPFVSYPVSFRHVPRVLSSSPQGSFVPNLVYSRLQSLSSHSSASEISCYHASVFLANRLLNRGIITLHRPLSPSTIIKRVHPRDLSSTRSSHALVHIPYLNRNPNRP